MKKKTEREVFFSNWSTNIHIHVCEILEPRYVCKRGKWGQGTAGGGRCRWLFFLFYVDNTFSMKRRGKSTQQLPLLFYDFTCVSKFSSVSANNEKKWTNFMMISHYDTMSAEKPLQWNVLVSKLIMRSAPTGFELQGSYGYQKKRNEMLYRNKESFFLIFEIKKIQPPEVKIFYGKMFLFRTRNNTNMKYGDNSKYFCWINRSSSNHMNTDSVGQAVRPLIYLPRTSCFAVLYE